MDGLIHIPNNEDSYTRELKDERPSLTHMFFPE